MESVKINFMPEMNKIILAMSEETEFGAAVRDLCGQVATSKGWDWPAFTKRGQYTRTKSPAQPAPESEE